MASEFQAFCRDLYIEGVSAVASTLTDPGMSNLLSIQMNTGLQLNKVNAQPSSLGADFNRFNFKLWDTIKTRWPARGQQLQDSLELLNDARNAIAHQDPVKLAQVRLKTPLAMSEAKRWRGNMDDLAHKLDSVVGAAIKDLTGAEPW
ncbi:hypothetical protein [Microbacterium sp. LWH13-1.2]|uniref:hypothetical protein n=1 Tax=Microbacterium sp. LWH13-1.2 TaxID=3135260 RepID=UPI003139B7CF